MGSILCSLNSNSVNVNGKSLIWSQVPKQNRKVKRISIQRKVFQKIKAKIKEKIKEKSKGKSKES